MGLCAVFPAAPMISRRVQAEEGDQRSMRQLLVLMGDLLERLARLKAGSVPAWALAALAGRDSARSRREGTGGTSRITQRTSSLQKSPAQLGHDIERKERE